MIDMHERIRPRRKITGMSAVLLPFHSNGSVDWESFGNLVDKTTAAGLVPAVNMDTGFGPLLDASQKQMALQLTQERTSGQPYVAGVFVADAPGSRFNATAYAREIEQVNRAGGTPIIFQSFGLAHQPDPEIIAHYQSISQHCDQFLAFELGTMFAEFGNIYSLDVFRELLDLPACVGAKHSSLSRVLEWQRLELRDQLRPDFKILTGNDLAIDMVMYGSDYLLGLSAFCPDKFAQRDAWWHSGDAKFYELNDKLQFLGAFAFRHPTAAYKHDAAMFLNLRGWIESDHTHPGSPSRPASDRTVLQGIGHSLDLDMYGSRQDGIPR